MTYIIPENVYTILKWAGLVACPAIAVFVGALGQAWQNAVVTTINATGVLIGALLGISQGTAKPEGGDEDDA